MPSAFSCGIVVPVRNEVDSLPKTVPALLSAVEGETPLILWVCNGCTDQSADMVRQLAGGVGEVLEIGSPGKTLALQAGDERLDAGHVFPRLYLDADTWLRPGDVARLLAPIREGVADLVAASHAFDYSRSSLLSAEMSRCWLALPFSREAAFLRAVGVSRQGRSHWEKWPFVIADDMYMAGMVSRGRRAMVSGAVATTWAPSSFLAWVGMRARWLRGERQLAKQGMGGTLPSGRQQRGYLLARLLVPRTSLGAIAFCCARLLASALSRLSSSVSWIPVRGSGSSS